MSAGETAAGSVPAAEIDPEDQARANLYALVSRLFHAPADSHLLAEICQAGEGAGEESAGGLVPAWRELQGACRSAYPPVVRQEYDGMFVGVGRAEVSPYLSGYADAAGPDRFLVRLRQQISALGLARRDGAFEMEDHVSGVTDVMRWLIESGRPLGVQRQFFETFLYPGASRFCAGVQDAPSANFYRLVARFTAQFLELEKAAFEMSE